MMKQTPTPLSSANNFPQPLRTLVVDDSIDLLNGLCDYLKAQPLFNVVGTAMDGCEALHKAELLKPDLILMDLHMPVMSGLEATAVLLRRVPNIRVVIMTLDDSVETELNARAQGVHGFIGKLKIPSATLLAEVRRAFHSTHPQDERPSP